MSESRAALALPGFVLAKAGLVADGEPSFDQWEEAGKRLFHIGGAVHWWIGDWLRYGEQKYGEMYSQALEATEFEYQTLRDAKWVAGRIEMSRRRDKLPWSFHKDVAVLEPDQQRELLQEAEAKGLTQRQLRARVKEVKEQVESEAEAKESGKEGVLDYCIEGREIYDWLWNRRERWPEAEKKHFAEFIRQQLVAMETEDDNRRKGDGSSSGATGQGDAA